MVETLNSVLFEDFHAAVEKTIELPLVGRLSDICTKSSSCEIEGIDEDETKATGDTTGKQRHREVFSSIGLGVKTLEEDAVEGVLC